MNREQARQLLPIIKAFADGADVQYQLSDGTWLDSVSPHFGPCDTYRIKPKPLEFWVVVANDLNSAVGVFRNRDNAEVDCDQWKTGRVIHVREVTE